MIMRENRIPFKLVLKFISGASLKVTAFFIRIRANQFDICLPLSQCPVVMEHNKWYETLKDQALSKNEQSAAIWSKYKNDLETTKSILDLLPKKMKHSVMVPIGPKALMQGTIVHTNEFLVNLGETWFVKKTAHETSELCDRRIKSCDEMLKRLQKEEELIVNKCTLPAEQEAFGNEERPEIIEYVTEKENEDWKKQHRIREREYRQKLAELRNKEKKSIETEEELWKHLDELELQEELEDELNRLNAGSDSSENGDNIEENSGVDNQILESVLKEENSESESKSVSSVKTKRKVSFVCDLESSDDEPLRLEIKHSSQQPIPSDPNSDEINSPADIYNCHLKLGNKALFSVLKNKSDISINNNVDFVQHYDTDTEEEEELNLYPTVSTGVHLNDISERSVSHLNHKAVVNKTKKISKFKISRQKFG